MLTFRIHPVKQVPKRSGFPKDKKSWWTVKIVEDQKAFKRECIKIGEKDKKTHTLARGLVHSNVMRLQTDGFGQIKQGQRKGCLGTMILIKDYLTVDILAHECLHAVFKTIQNEVGVLNLWLPPDMFICIEEYLCYMEDGYVKQITDMMRRKKLPLMYLR